MLKPMSKKALPTPPEWQAGGVGSGAGQIAATATSAALPVYNATALRIQVRYLKYQAKVRALLKKSDRLTDGNQPQQQENGAATAATKVVARDRAVTGSSMALAVAIQAKTGAKDGADATAEASTRQKTAPVVPSAYSPPDMRAGARPEPAAASAWRNASTAWPMPPLVADPTQMMASDEGEQRRGDGEPEGEESGSDDGRLSSSDCIQWTAVGEATLVASDEDEDSKVERPPSGFVNVMESSWLLSSIEQRCRQQGGDNGPKRRSIAQLADLRHLMLDMLFIFRSGVDVNLHGRPPSSVSVHRQNLIARVSERVMEDGGELSTDDKRRVARIFRGLQSDMIMPAVRCLGWILTKTWRMLFHGLHVDIDSLHCVREILEAAEGDMSVVFTPTHKTHLDYLIISYLCFAYGIPLPRIAAGNNLDLPVIGSFLRANGSFFIRRSFRGDHLYQQVLEHYVHELLSDGNPVEVFIEGGRSRHGRVCKPRLGFLSMFLDYVRQPSSSKVDAESNTEKDESKKTVLLVPISLDYDKVYEVEEYANQLLGKPKEKESLKVFFKSVWDIVFLRCGHTYVRFGEPVAVTAESSLDEVAHAVSTRMQTAGTVTATAVISSLLMWKRTYITREMLDARAMWLVQELEARGATVAHDDDDDLVDHALSILNVKVAANGVVSPHAEFPVRALELGFYRNHVLHVFLPEMAVAGAIDCLLRSCEPSGCDTAVVSLDCERVVDKARMMWKYLRHICRHDDVDVEQQVAQFLESNRACKSDGSAVHVDTQQWRSIKMIGLLLSLHWSFADSLWISTLGLWSLGDKGSAPTDREFVRRVQTLAKDLFVRKQLRHAEALCGETIKQAVDFLVEQSVVRREHATDGSVGRVLVLAEGDEDSVEDLAREVNSWRQPRAFLWKSSAPPANVGREDARALMADAGASIYARWMAPPV